MRKTSPKDVPLYDGKLMVYELGNVSGPGEYPREGLKKIWVLPYQEKTVGIKRFYSAHENQIEISHVVRCPRPPDRILADGSVVDPVTTLEKVMLPNGRQYNVVQVQYLEDEVPRLMDLSLSAMERKLDVYDSDVIGGA